MYKSSFAADGGSGISVDSTVPGATEARHSTKVSAAQEIRQLRGKCQNAMHFTLMMMLNVFNRRLAALLCYLSEHVQLWYHDQAVTLNNAEAARQWLLEQLGGNWWTPIRKIWGSLSTTAVLEQLGFKARFAASDVDTVVAFDPPPH